jgi:Flp pilus assembly pilin Flp
MFSALKKLYSDEAGLSTVEYALLLVLIVIAGVTAWQALGGKVSSQVGNVTSTLNGT